MSNCEVTLLVSSCDKDEDTWYPFFKLFEKYWYNFPKEWGVVLNTETKKFIYKNIDIVCDGGGADRHNLSWTKRLYNVVKKIESDYIILTLSDYFLLDYVKQEEIEKIIFAMKERKEIGYICLYPNEHSEKEDEEILNEYVRCKKGTSYVINAQVGIWKKDYLLRLLRMNRSPWEWEILGSELSYWLDESVYVIKSSENLPYPYDWRADGVSIYSRMWTRKCKEFFVENDIDTDIDFNIRGVWNPETPHKSVGIKKDLRYYMRDPFFKRLFNRIMRGGHK